jgi:hypothetical protein
MAFDSRDDLYAVNHEAGNIAVFNAYDGFQEAMFQDRFGDIACLWIDQKNLMYIGDRANSSVTISRTDGTEMLTFGSLGTGPYHFERLSGLCVDSRGRLYISDSGTGTVSVYRPVTP